MASASFLASGCLAIEYPCPILEFKCKKVGAFCIVAKKSFLVEWNAIFLNFEECFLRHSCEDLYAKHVLVLKW